MTNPILLKRSATPAKVPLTSDMVLGELAMNTNDGRLFLKKNNGVETVIEVGAVYTVFGRTGNVVLDDVDIATALGYTPYDAANPANYITAAQAPVQSVAGRTGAVVLTVVDVSGAAPLASPTFTGVPLAPTAAPGTNTMQIATTAFVSAAVSAATAGVSTFNGRTGDVTLTSGDVTTALGYTPVNPTIIGQPGGLATLDGTGRLTLSQLPEGIGGGFEYKGAWNASTNTPNLQDGVGEAGDLYKVSVAGSTNLGGNSIWRVNDILVYNGTTWDVFDGTTAEVSSFNGRTGIVTLTSGDVTTSLGFTPYDAANPANYITSAGAPVQSVAGRTGAVVLTNADVSGSAPLASPALTGVPTAPTAAQATNTTQIATTAYVQSQNYITAATAPVTSVAGRTGAIVLTTDDVSGTIDGGAY